ncbi:MAG: methionine adenosyltransferase, partial [Actinobacteria bacterium ATB1]|nr:methionine adenosyltransferase [Actinobacteria bacterium ATB1]
WVAKNIVASGAADRAEVQIAYAIGKAAPVSFMVETFGTSQIAPEKLADISRETFDLRPAAIVRDLDLLRPIYKKTAAYGHFGRHEKDLTWEATDRADRIRAAAESVA